MANRGLTLRDRLLREALALLYIFAIALAAQFSGWYFLLFPELGAVSHDVLTRPWGKWASQPARLVVTPAAGAAIGTFATREFPYRVPTILLIVTVCLLLLALLRSNIAPAISAGTLPLVLDIKSDPTPRGKPWACRRTPSSALMRREDPANLNGEPDAYG